MITILEYLLSKSSPKLNVITPKSNSELRNIILTEVEKNGPNVDLNYIDVSEITDMNNMFKDIDFYGDISEWDMSHVLYANEMFSKCTSFCCDLSKWNLSSLIEGARMFYACRFLDCDMSNWGLDELKTSTQMFQLCVHMKGKGTNKWRISKLVNADNMFAKCDALDTTFESWNTETIEEARSMFLDCRHLDNKNKNDWSKWDIKSLRISTYMFSGCKNLKGKGMGSWKPKKIEEMNEMFADCYFFNEDLSSWVLDNLDSPTFAKSAFANTYDLPYEKYPVKLQPIRKY